MSQSENQRDTGFRCRAVYRIFICLNDELDPFALQLRSCIQIAEPGGERVANGERFRTRARERGRTKESLSLCIDELLVAL